MQCGVEQNIFYMFNHRNRIKRSIKFGDLMKYIFGDI